ncbi:MAG: OsmC family protein [Candidatus Methanoperedens sp.]|nr:OsmC family protein [Candidatus Methanoperedens sp.]
MMVNRVDVDKFRETVENTKKDTASGKKTMEVEGEWRLGKTGPQFESRIKTEKGGEITLFSDETLILGGGGTAPNPVQYCIYGLIACYAATFAKWAAMEGIVLRSFRIKATANMDLTRAFGVTDNPILEHLKWEMIVDSDTSMEKLEKLNEIAKERCPGYYCVTHAIFPEITLKKVK